MDKVATQSLSNRQWFKSDIGYVHMPLSRLPHNFVLELSTRRAPPYVLKVISSVLKAGDDTLFIKIMMYNSINFLLETSCFTSQKM